MQLPLLDRNLFRIFVVFSLIELIGRSYIPTPSLTFLLAIGLYYWIYISIRYIKITRVRQYYNATFLIYLYVLWNVIVLLRGLIDSNNYWDYKMIFITKGPFLLFVFSIFLASRLELMRKIFVYLVNYYLLASIIFIRPVFWGNTGRIICSYIPLLFLWVKKYKLRIVLFLIISFPFTFGARGWQLRAFFGIGLALVYYFFKKRKMLLDKIYRTIYVICIIFPLIFLYLGYTGKFNVFHMEDYVETENKENIIDTRSFLYMKVNNTLKERDKQWIGLGGISNYWYDFGIDDDQVEKIGRYSTESGVLNMYLYGGWIGAFLFSMLFWISAYYGIFRSNNDICKLLGTFIIFRWIISFVDEPEIWLCSNLMMFFSMGVCLNKCFRQWDNSIWKNIYYENSLAL